MGNFFRFTITFKICTPKSQTYFSKQRKNTMAKNKLFFERDKTK